jgi:hypothetical protein
MIWALWAVWILNEAHGAAASATDFYEVPREESRLLTTSSRPKLNAFIADRATALYGIINSGIFRYRLNEKEPKGVY